MRVTMLKTLSNVRQTWLEGEQYDLPDQRAENWIRSKVAQPVAAGLPLATLPTVNRLASRKARKGATQ